MSLMERMEAGKRCGMEHASWSRGIPGSMGRNFVGGRTLESGRLQPRAKPFGCNTWRVLSALRILCIR